MFLFLFFLLQDTAKAAPEAYVSGIRALQHQAFTQRTELSRTFFRLEKGSKVRAFWGKTIVGTEENVGVDAEEMRQVIDEARASGASIRICNFHIHPKQARLRLQKERNEFPLSGNRSFPPSGADVQISLVGEDAWKEWVLSGESSMGVIDSLGVWMYRDLGNADSPARRALYQKQRFQEAEIEAVRASNGDAAEGGRYEFMRLVNAAAIDAEQIRLLPAYRKLVLQYAVLENIELKFLPLEEVKAEEACRGF